MTDLPRFMLKPLRDGYTYSIARNTISTPTESGRTRQRRGSIGKPHIVNATYQCTKPMWQYFTAFFRQYEAQSFLAYLLIGDTELQWYQCRCLNDDIPTSIAGRRLFKFQLTLEVIPLPVDVIADSAVVEAYNLTNGSPGIFLQLLEGLANDQLPD